MSFREKVLDALDITKKTIKLQVNESFPPVYSESASNTAITGETAAYDRTTHLPYAVSKEIISSSIGPATGGGTVKQKLDVLGFVVGNPVIESTYKNMYPVTMPSSALVKSSPATHDDDYTGFHSLNGLYDIHSTELRMMRKASIPDLSDEIMYTQGGTTAPADHGHHMWPDNTLAQTRLLTENPYADSLFYHSTRMSFLLTGITVPEMSEKASNHRGVVRMLIVRPRIPTVRTRWTGTSNQPSINMDYPPHFDTDLFYTKTKTLGGRLDSNLLSRYTDPQTGASNKHANRKTHLTPSFGLKKYADPDPQINQVVNEPTAVTTTAGDGTTTTEVTNNVPNVQLHYGHPIPTDGTDHTLSAYDVLTAPINREKYAVVVDKMVTLDTLHHGVASKRIENVVIPYNKKIKFAGRQASSAATDDGLSKKLGNTVETEPVNFQSRPIIMFLSMDQKISAQVTGYTTISEC